MHHGNPMLVRDAIRHNALQSLASLSGTFEVGKDFWIDIVGDVLVGYKSQ
jgi:hypothetical protein